MEKPSFFSAGGDKDRFTAWDKLKGTTKEQAQSQYIELAKQALPWLKFEN